MIIFALYNRINRMMRYIANFHLVLNGNYKLKLVIAAVAVALLVSLYFYFFETQPVVIELVSKVKNPTKKRLNYGGIIFGNRDHQDFNETLYEWLGDSLSGKSNIDLVTNDYIIGFGSPIKTVYYYQHIKHPRDDCKRKVPKPVTAEYESVYTDSIYFYKIAKGKYRNTCP